MYVKDETKQHSQYVYSENVAFQWSELQKENIMHYCPLKPYALQLSNFIILHEKAQIGS